MAYYPKVGLVDQILAPDYALPGGEWSGQQIVSKRGIALARIGAFSNTTMYHTKPDGTLLYVPASTTMCAMVDGIPMLRCFGYQSGSLNNITYSKLMTTNWTNSNVTLSAAIADPGGTTTAYTLTDNTTTAEHYIRAPAVTIGSGTADVHNYSIYAKAGTAGFISLRPNVGGSANTVFDLVGGTVASGTGVITAVGATGWYRCSTSRTNSGGLTSSIFDIKMGTTAANAAGSYAGTGSTVSLFGPQMPNAGQGLRDYMPTDSAGVQFSGGNGQSYTAPSTASGFGLITAKVKMASFISGGNPIISSPNHDSTSPYWVIRCGTTNTTIESFTSGTHWTGGTITDSASFVGRTVMIQLRSSSIASGQRFKIDQLSGGNNIGVNASGASFNIGSSNRGIGNFDGWIGDIRIFDYEVKEPWYFER